MKKSNFLLVVAFVSILFSCTDEDDSLQDVTSFVNTEIDIERFGNISGNWSLNTINLNSGIELTPDVPVSITFSSEETDTIINYELNGTSTCNLYGGRLLSIGLNTISFEELFVTEQLCESESLNNFEELYFDTLFKSTEYSINGNSLILLSEDEITINYERRNE